MAKHPLLWQWEKWERTCGSYCPVQKDKSRWVCIKMALFNQQKHSCVTVCVLDAIFSIAAKNARSLRFTAIDTLCVAVVGFAFMMLKAVPNFRQKNLVKSVVLNWFCFKIPDLNTKNWSNCQDYQKIDQKNLKYLYWTAQAEQYATLFYLFFTLYMVLQLCQDFSHDY